MLLNWIFSSSEGKELLTEKNLRIWKSLLRTTQLAKAALPLGKLTSSNDPNSELIAAQMIMATSLSARYSCLYPARSSFIEKLKTNNIEKNNQNHQFCDTYLKFKKTLDKKNISIIYASEFLNAPSSAFGHVLLVFHDDAEISPFDQVIHFAAAPNPNDSFFKYMFNGLTGGYTGSFHRTYAFKKLHEYVLSEQRRIYQYPLELSSYQKKFLIARLFEFFQHEYNYYFFTKNCAFYIEELVSSLTDGVIKSITPYNLPIMAVKSGENLIEKMKVIHPYFEKALQFETDLNEKEIGKFNQIISGTKTLSEDDSEELKSAVFYTYKYNFRKSRKILPNYKKNLYFKSQEKISSKLQEVDDPLKRSNPTSLEIGYISNLREAGPTYRLMTRPVNQDLFSNQYGRMHESSLKLGELKLNYSSDQLQVEEFTIVEMFLNRDILTRSNPISWYGSAGWSRLGPNTEIKPEIKAGIGLGVDGLLIATIIPSFTIRELERVTVMPSFKLHVGSNLTPKIKVTLISDLIYRKNKLYSHSEFRAGYKHSPYLDLFLGLQSNSLESKELQTSFRLNF